MRLPRIERRTGAIIGVAAAATLIASVLVLGGGDGSTRNAAEPGPSQSEELPVVPVPEGPDAGAGTLFGVHTKVEGENSETKAATTALEGQLGRTVDINHHFYPWNERFPTDLERWDLDHGRLPLISWNGRDAYASDIAEGRYDALIQDRAVQVKALGEPVLIRWFWEMDGKKKAEWAQSPADYIAAWRHIHGVFAAFGVTNVSWVWCPNASAFEDGEAQGFYPGPEYVDWVCADGYNWAPGRRGDQWETFDDIFGGFYLWAAELGKPIMVGEYGVQERRAGDKAGWVRDVRNAVKTRFPLIRALVYFHANQDYDWRMDTKADSFAAFRELANDPWFNPHVEGALPTG